MKTTTQIKELLEQEQKPLHLKEIAKKIGKTRQACYTAIHTDKEQTFKKTSPATYDIK